eukprot:TRINITY_DN54177_c0_g1_i1.p1 TRINITY_DN54177_c0_g1~~TRINITY_DN54177_c0_g1_i1.p1  ORF type:complete len:998 (-),score=295.89 TRINITY_DN54177_c0_g1_i1:174-3167(-)
MGKKSKVGKGRLDKYYHLAKDQGYRARSAFKLIQLAKKVDFLSKSRICIDLCAAPGGWSQVAQKNMPLGSKIIAIDLCPIKPIQGVTCIQSDITSDKCRSLVRKELKGEKADVVLHDGAPNVGSSWVKDAYGQCELTLQSARIACEHLKQGGCFVTKVFRSADYNSLLWVFNQLFTKVEATKPQSSRNVSAEIFCICTGFKAGKIDPRFFDPKWVFMETVDPEPTGAARETKGAGATLSDLMKGREKKHRGGYEPGDDMKILPAHTFIQAENPAQLLVTHHRMSLDAAGSEEYSKHELTTDEIRELCADLQILGKRDLTQLLKWRMRIIRTNQKAERKSRKAEVAATAEAAKEDGAKGAASGAKGSMDQDVDDAIAGFLNEDGEDDADDESEVDEELERDLAEMVEKRRREEKIEQKKTMARQRKMEWKKKLSLGGGKEHENQDAPELFKINARNVQALEDEDKYVVPKESDDESDKPVEPDESDSDDELDRVARMEVDLAVNHELQRARDADMFRNSLQRKQKKKKESRRQRVMAAWSGELAAFNESIDAQAAAALKDKEDDDADDDSDMDEDELKQLRRLQNSAVYGEEGEGGADGEALEALLDGGHPEEKPRDGSSGGGKSAAFGGDGSEDESDDEQRPMGRLEGGERRKALMNGKKGSEGAIVPYEENSEETLRQQRRAERWFSQDIFKNAQVAKRQTQLAPLDKASDDSGSDGERDDAAINEFKDNELPQLPLTDKEKRKLKRKREQERLEWSGKKPKGEEDNRPMEVAPLEAPKPLVPTGPQKPTDPQELAETLALGSLLVNSKKSRMEVIDAAYNRWSFDYDPTLPEWFTEDENKHNKPELPVSKELMNQFRSKLKEINARPIRKVAEAKARKNRRLKHRLEKLRSTAMGLAENDDMTEAARARHMRKAVSKMARESENKVKVVAIKKAGGGRQTTKGKVPKGAKTKVVDKRMRSDMRAEKRAAKKNPGRQKLVQKKLARKQAKNGRRKR